MSLEIYTNIITLDSFSYEISKHSESVILTIHSQIEDDKTKLGRFDASISYRDKKEYYFDYIGHAHSRKTPALYGILLGLAKLKRSISLVVFLDLSIYTIRNPKDREIYDQIERMAEKKGVSSLTIIGVQDGETKIRECSIEPQKTRKKRA
ncbi:MAG: hypothetical protein Q4C49_14470 [Bacillota bacterium]|nr:hypothetical protein [Bacillota bacterium]